MQPVKLPLNRLIILSEWPIIHRARDQHDALAMHVTEYYHNNNIYIYNYENKKSNNNNNNKRSSTTSSHLFRSGAKKKSALAVVILFGDHYFRMDSKDRAVAIRTPWAEYAPCSKAQPQARRHLPLECDN